MKIRVASDIHLEFCQHNHGVPDLGSADVLILGGDILCAKHFKTNGNLHKVYNDFLQKCADNFEHVLYIKGNHEHWGLNYDNTHDTIKDHLPPNIRLLENEAVTINNWTFLCATLWTDFRNENPLEMMEARRLMNDYRTIRIGSNYRKLNPDDTLGFHKKSKQFLIEKLEEHKNDNVWIMTHHAPTWQSISPDYKTSTINSAFVSDLDDLIINNPQIKYWHHGHVHNFFDYFIGNCRVICNPLGYPGEKTGFNPNFTVEI